MVKREEAAGLLSSETRSTCCCAPNIEEKFKPWALLLLLREHHLGIFVQDSSQAILFTDFHRIVHVLTKSPTLQSVIIVFGLEFPIQEVVTKINPEKRRLGYPRPCGMASRYARDDRMRFYRTSLMRSILDLPHALDVADAGDIYSSCTTDYDLNRSTPACKGHADICTS